MILRTTGLMLSALSAFALASAAFAQTAETPPTRPSIDQRIENQQKRIDAGVEKGTITPEQAARDTARTERIGKRADALEAKQGGELNKRQEHRMNRALNKNSRAIHHQRKN